MMDVSFFLALCAGFMESDDQSRAKQLYTMLAQEVDLLRSKYWTMKADKIAA